MSDPKATALARLAAGSATYLAEHRASLQRDARAAGATLDEIEAMLNGRHELPRSLLRGEAEVLNAVINRLPSPAREQLREQSVAVRVTGYCSCGCATVDLEAPSSSLRVSGVASPLDVDVVVSDEAGVPVGAILVFLDKGKLSLLEVISFGDPISPFPGLERISCERSGSS